MDIQKKIMQYVKDNFTFRNLGVYICLSTGMRIGEICGLKWCDINLTTETISVNRTIERIYIIDGDKRHTELIISTPKTQNSIREIPMNRELLKLIKPLKRLMNNDYFVLTNEAKPTEPRTYRNYYKQLLKQLEIPDLGLKRKKKKKKQHCGKFNKHFKNDPHQKKKGTMELNCCWGNSEQASQRR